MHNGFHSFNHLNCAQQETETNVNAHEHTLRARARAKKRNARNIHIKCIELALHFYCLFVCSLACLFVCWIFPIHSFFTFVLFVSFLVHSFSLSSPSCAVNEVFHFYTRISYPRCWFGIHASSLLDPFIEWLFGLFFFSCCYCCCCLFSTSHALTARPPFCRSFGSFFYFSASSWSYLWNAHELWTKTIRIFQMKYRQNASIAMMMERHWKNRKKKTVAHLPLCSNGKRAVFFGKHARMPLISFYLSILFDQRQQTPHSYVNFRCTWHRIMANRLPSLSFSIHTIHFHSRIYDIFFAGYSAFSRFRRSLPLSTPLSLSRYSVQFVLIFINFSMRSWLSFMHTHTARCTCTLCAVQPAIIFPFLSCVSAYFFRCSPHLSYSKTQVIFHLCALFFIRCAFCLFYFTFLLLLLLALSFEWFKLRPEYEYVNGVGGGNNGYAHALIQCLPFNNIFFLANTAHLNILHGSPILYPILCETYSAKFSILGGKSNMWLWLNVYFFLSFVPFLWMKKGKE